jgi:invasion associated locus B (IalB) protein
MARTSPVTAELLNSCRRIAAPKRCQRPVNRLHIAEFASYLMLLVGFGFRQEFGCDEEGPMTAFRIILRALPIALTACLTTGALAQQPPKTAAVGGAQPTLLGQFADWGAYTASPNGAKVCFALGKPKTSQTNPPGRNRDPAYIFVSTRPSENVKNEVSVIIGYPFKEASDATAEIGAAKFAMYTQKDGAWIKNVAEEARMIDAMRKGADLTVKGTSGRGTLSTDVYSLKGLSQALDRAEQECK